MYVVEVIPVQKGLRKETLTYFSNKERTRGEVVSVPLRKKLVPAVVLSSADASEHKQDIRRRPHALRKISEGAGRQLFLPASIEAARACALRFATTTGEVLHAFAPIGILRTSHHTLEGGLPPTPPSNTRGECLLLQAERVERVSFYRSLIREEFAKGRSVLIMVPTIGDAEVLGIALSRGIENKTEVFTSAVRESAQRKAWRRIANDRDPLLAIATFGFLFLPRSFGTIVVERESSSAYRTIMAPHLDARVYAEEAARSTGARLIFGDFPLRVETLERIEEGVAEELVPLRARSHTSAQPVLADMRTREKTDQKGMRHVEILGTELEKALTLAGEDGESGFLFCARRGLAPLTLCGDCGSTVACLVCGAPVTLHKGSRENVFLCHSCGTARSAHESCKVCRGWKLATLGIGIDLVVKELKTRFPERPLFVLESGTVASHKEARDLVAAFRKNHAGILVGTEMALPYLPEHLPLIGVVSADSLLSLSGWRTSERAFSTLVTLRSSATHYFVLQTRRPGDAVVRMAFEGAVLDFLREERARRKDLSYPPFSTLIRLTASGSRAAVSRSMEKLEKTFSDVDLLRYVPMNRTGKDTYSEHALMRLPRGMWPNELLATRLRELGADVHVHIDPENLL